jgi:hypothetical protein
MMFSSAENTLTTPIFRAVIGINIMIPCAPRGDTAAGRQRDSW